MTKLEEDQEKWDKFVRESIATLKKAQAEIVNALPDTSETLQGVIEWFEENSTPGKFLGSKGGNTPTKPGSRPRGRPRKNAISETPSKAV